jgi:hypothetical protein
MILDLTLNSKEYEISKESGKLLKNILRNFSFHYPLDCRSFNSDVWNSKESTSDKWGEYQHLDDLKIEWHVPNEQEMNTCTEFMNQYLEGTFNNIQQFIQKQNSQPIKNQLKTIYYILIGGSCIFQEMKKDVIPNQSK